MPKNVDERAGTALNSPQRSDQGDSEAAPGSAPMRRISDRPRTIPLWNNTITMLVLFGVGMAIGLMLTFWLFTIVTPAPNPYIDIVGYLVLPSLLVMGVLLIPTGILFKSWRLRRRDPQQRLAFRFPHVDLNDPAQRRAAKIVVLGMFIVLPVVVVSGYHGYHYTDSAEFCSKACHAAMHPQATTYEHSAHARVTCAACHIGAGASWFVKAKLSGTRQVLAMWRDSFSRPIPPAIQHLRPARETCEQCHWPRKFFGAQLREIVRFKSDEANTRLEIDMLLNTGGGDEATGRAEGIHMHMALAGRIEYIATDAMLQQIPWVRYVDRAGNELIYRSDGRPSSDPRPDAPIRTLDCMDCHNRPAHKFRSPQDAVDIFLDVGKIDTTLPFIKREAVAALVNEYPDAETAKRQIASRLTEFYKANYPQVWEYRKASVNDAIDKVRELYSRSFFPMMKVDWKTYPDNIGHHISPGCFRCHEGKHVNQRGEPLSHECSICHTFLNRVKRNGGTLIAEGEFAHPFTLEGVHAEARCDQCHDGGVSPSTTCAGCHAEQTSLRNGTNSAFAAFNIAAEPMAETVDCEGCHDLTEPTSVESVDAMCMDCHDDEEERFEGMLATWKKEVDDLFGEAESRVGENGRLLLEKLRQAGPLHNVEATRTIVRALLDHPQGVEAPRTSDTTH